MLDHNNISPQIGDNDSGRFFKVTPLFRDGPGEGELKEEHLDHRGTIAAINGLFDRRDLSDFVGPETDLEMAIVSALSSGIKVASYLSKGGQMRASAQLDGKAGFCKINCICPHHQASSPSLVNWKGSTTLIFLSICCIK